MLKPAPFFVSQLLAVLRGDPKAMKDIPTSANGFGHETLDLAEENQQLKVSHIKTCKIIYIFFLYAN